MGTLIEWTQETWNPIKLRWRNDSKPGHWCLKVSPGCEYCYAGRMQPFHFGGQDFMHATTESLMMSKDLVRDGDIYLDEDVLEKPLHMRTPRRIFVCSMTDLFGEWVPADWIRRIFRVMSEAPQHTFQILTKRPTRMKHIFEDDLHWYAVRGDPAPQLHKALPNVWLGVTIESDLFTWRAKELAEIPAAIRFVSAEPLLSALPSLEFTRERQIPLPEWSTAALESGAQEATKIERLIDWIIVGGESGGPLERRLLEECPGQECSHPGCDLHSHCMHDPKTRMRPKPERLEWVRDLRDRAKSAGTAFFFKQWGGATPRAGGRMLYGREWNEAPIVPWEIQAWSTSLQTTNLPRK